MTASKLFLSHASQDRPIADLLRETLVLGGVPNDVIFYSSSRDTGIPSGTEVRGHLKAELQQAGLVVELITAAFLTRPMCLMELGGAWALDVATYPIVLPPLERADVAQQIGDVHMGLLGSDSDIDDVFDELHDRLESDLAVRTPTRTWNAAIRSFKRNRLGRQAEGQVERLRVMDWEHGRISRQRLAYADGLREGRLAMEGGRAARREEFAQAAAHIELYASTEVVVPWKEFFAALNSDDLEQARADFEAFTLAARSDDQKTS